MYISRGLFSVILLSSCLNEPAAAFLAFANCSSSSTSLSEFNFSKSSLPINTSPRTTMSIGSFSFLGIVFIVFKFSVTSSPTTPSPLVAPLTNTPFLYSKAADKPSILVSTTYSNFVLFSLAAFFILSSKSLTSSKENTSCKLCKGISCVTFLKPFFILAPTFCVGESSLINSGYSFSIPLSSFISMSYS